MDFGLHALKYCVGDATHAGVDLAHSNGLRILRGLRRAGLGRRRRGKEQGND